MRIAYVIHDLRVGGMERRLLAVLAGLDRDRFHPLICCLDGLGELAGEARALGLEPVVLGRRRTVELRAVARLARLLRRERVAVVHGWLGLPNVFARIAGTLARVPVRIASTGATVIASDSRRAVAYALLDRVLTPFTDAYLANSEAVAVSMRERGIPAGKIVVIPNGVAVVDPLAGEERARLRAQLGAGPGEQLIGMVARLEPAFKDLGTLLASVAALASEGRPVRAAIIGDGPAREMLGRRAEELGVADRVIFTGYRPDASCLLSALDVSVLLSYSEGFSNVVLESMAAGVPLVVTDIPPNREAVRGEVEGLFVPVRDLEATTAALRRLLDDRAFSARLGEAARRRAREQYSLAAQAASMMRLYDDLLERQGARL